ncbi:hypothetical protein ON010_g18290 [Phytophthora cinnamomi]|nr:hypothetical protein ON010_g18290 [Phytophthora cinnamomi]
MVYPLRTCLVAAALALVAMQPQQITASPLKDDLVTECSSFDLNNPDFPGRGTEIPDNGACTITQPKYPTKPNLANNPTVPVKYKNLLANNPAPVEPLYTKVGRSIMFEETPPSGSNQDDYLTAPGTPTKKSNTGNLQRPQATAPPRRALPLTTTLSNSRSTLAPKRR